MIEKFITFMLIGRNEERGATAIILGVTFFGTQLQTYFSSLGTTVGSWAGN